ncbi:MAG: DUF4268 domain-containing protein, partial [Anaerolineae bacterium]|nr:DUF4268 domain-containing protein [Anaerolineae bacterium]
MIGKLQRVSLRTVWPHEALDFTPWLQDNLDVLNEALGLNLDNAEREQAAGSFSVDLVAEDESSRTVIIENQLERSDHDHLGKILTYLSSFDADVAIWIVQDPRPEHVNAINWLNESSSADFYLVKLEAVQIGASPPAPLFTQIVGPSIEAKQVGTTKKGLAERKVIRYRFWDQLLTTAKQNYALFAKISPSRESWISAGSGKRGIIFQYNVRQYDSLVQLKISGGTLEENKHWYDQLVLQKDDIEARFGAELDWRRLDNQRNSRIIYVLTDGGYRSEEADWPQIQAHMIDAMSRLETAFKP